MPDDARIPPTTLGFSPEAFFEDTRAEQALLGALLANSGLVHMLPRSFSPDHYSDPLHAELHRAIAEIGQPNLPVAVPVLQRLGLVDQETKTYVAGLLAGAVSYLPATIAVYADATTDMYRRHRLHAVGAEMQVAALAKRGEKGVGAAIARAMNQLDELISDHGTDRPHVTLDDAMDAALAKADQVASGRVDGLSTGFRSVDGALGALEPGAMLVLAGRPGMGKSALGWQIALNVALSGNGVLAVSLEMSALELARRALCAFAGVPLSALKQGQHGPHVKHLLEARARLRGLPLSIEDGGGLTAGMIALKARAARRRHKGLGLILVDHLHIVRPDEADVRSGPTWAVGRVSGAMKRLAKDNECPALVLAQLNRGVEGREDKRPTLSDLRHAGDIEQDADAVGFVYRPEYYLGPEPEMGPDESREKFASRQTRWGEDRNRLRGKAEVIFAKVRDGAPCTLPFQFHHETTSFSEIKHDV